MTAPGALRFYAVLQDVNWDAARCGGEIGAGPEKAGAAALKNIRLVF